jgi:hypothetical protein
MQEILFFVCCFLELVSSQSAVPSKGMVMLVCMFVCFFPRSVSRFLQEAVVVTHVHRQRR